MGSETGPRTWGLVFSLILKGNVKYCQVLWSQQTKVSCCFIRNNMKGELLFHCK